MPKYRVYGKITASKYLGEYEADSADEAEEMAIDEHGSITLCHQCSGECADPEIHECDVEEIGTGEDEA